MIIALTHSFFLYFSYVGSVIHILLVNKFVFIVLRINTFQSSLKGYYFCLLSSRSFSFWLFMTILIYFSVRLSKIIPCNRDTRFNLLFHSIIYLIAKLHPDPFSHFDRLKYDQWDIEIDYLHSIIWGMKSGIDSTTVTWSECKSFCVTKASMIWVLLKLLVNWCLRYLFLYLNYLELVKNLKFYV